jgi:hypothetical protein
MVAPDQVARFRLGDITMRIGLLCQRAEIAGHSDQLHCASCAEAQEKQARQGDQGEMARTLRGLERDGIVTRTILATSPPFFEKRTSSWIPNAAGYVA